MRKIKIQAWIKKHGYKSIYEVAKKFKISEPTLGRWARSDAYRMYDHPKPLFIHTPPSTTISVELR